MTVNALGRTIAVTGATGFIGMAVVRSLVASGWGVKAMVRPASQSKFRGVADVRAVIGTLEDEESLRRLVQGAYAVVHCAGAVRGVTDADFGPANVAGVERLRVAVTAQHPTPPRFLLLSSLAAREPGLSPYAASKRHGEEVLTQRGGDLQWTALRPPAVYGPGDKELLPLFRLMARGIGPRLGAANARFSLLYVEDLVRAVLSWLHHDSCRSEILELHDGHSGGYSWSDVADTVGSLTGRSVFEIPVPGALLNVPARINALAGRLSGYAPMLTPGKLRELRHPDWVCDNGAVCSALGWTPAISLREGLRLTLNGTSH